MLQSAKPLDPVRVIREALSRAGPIIFCDNFVAYLILAIFSVIDGALMRNYKYTGTDLLSNAYPLSAWLSAIAFYFTLAAAMRRTNPAYKMTLVTALGVTSTVLLALIGTAVGLLCLIVPGIWIGTKLSLAPYTYALRAVPSSSADALTESWALTTGYFWPTASLALLQILFAFVPVFLLSIGALALFSRWHFSAYFTAPALLFVNVFFSQVSNLALLEWTSILRAQKNVPVPAPPESGRD
ncbi:MAG: hypothetical protein M3126_09050 [Candidatus Eremiobacteraeota bacterium]|nr:hypothetical protein [Candidatus Eremiobacteraeota bacterium]